MAKPEEFTSPADTPVLLVEADLNARSRHESVLRSAGYAVLASSACPDPGDLQGAAVLLSDVASFHWIQDQQLRQIPPTIVLTSDDKAGITACLCGADAWVPVDSDDAYLLDALDGVLRPGGAAP